MTDRYCLVVTQVDAHDTRVESTPLVICENRKSEIQRQLFFEDTQPASDVLRRRIRERREAKGLRQENWRRK